MRILIVTLYGIERSGLIIFADRLQNGLIRLGVKVTLLSVCDQESTSDTLNNRVICFATEHKLFVWLQQHYQQYDVVLWAGFHQELTGIHEQILVSAFLREKHKKKVFFLWERTGASEVISDPNLLKHLTEDATDGIMVLNDTHFKELLEQSVPSGLIHIWSPGVDTENKFKPPTSPDKKVSIRKILGWEENKVTILLLARFEKRKRIDCLLETWLGDPSLAEGAQLIIVGSSFGQDNDTEQRIYSLAMLGQNVTVVPYKSNHDRAHFYQASDVFVALGDLEGEPTVLSEAMACGLPVIASETSGHKYLVRNNYTGLLVRCETAFELQSALHLMISDEDYRIYLGKNSRQLVVEQRDILVVAKKLLKIILSKN